MQLTAPERDVTSKFGRPPDAMLDAVPTSMTVDDHLAALDAAGTRLITAAIDAGWEASVPTCPRWTARALVAHQAMVHRWAAANVRGDDGTKVPSQTEILQTVVDLPTYYGAGLRKVSAALRAAPLDLEAMRFLNDAPPARAFWARRQAHETTIHMVDALAARLGRVPATDETEIDAPLAADGIDELVRGFFTRGRSKLYDGREYTIAVEPSDVDRRWILHVSSHLTVEPDGRTSDPADATLTGSAAALYLGLWNRGDEIAVTGPPEMLERWRSTQQIKWS